MMRRVFVWLVLWYSLGAAAAPSVVLPLSFENGVPVVTLDIGGKSLPFILDTGASDALYLNSQAQKAFPGVQRTGKTVKSIDAGGKVAVNDELIVPMVNVNGMGFGAITGRTMTPWGIVLDSKVGPPPHSVLGLKFFDKKRVLFDFRARQVTIWDGPADETKVFADWQSVAFKRAGEGLLVSLQGVKQSFSITLDSASTISLFNGRSLPDSQPTTDCAIQLKPNVPCRAIALDLNDGDKLPLIVADFPERFHADGLVGRAFFDRYAVFLDNASGTLRVRRHAD